ncbi:acetylglutamate kinase [Aerococcus sanguinicola]|nr:MULTISPECIES: acetylglutamate kinase [unclassified Aerococcus]MDK6233546.1 acetylglutamate kinase [Aerococcus sp. UMB10185]MDK6856103.1 acetylglutamate kinase [Aerococcus sp. UMB7533]MDK8501524.1 acetylglutamate kinase [Aerococcus sp. UMB1112A]OFN01319.1 acetylglutamate kinase [Aerococcus sp. HMSC062A02]OHO46258.1 acetylglutamate kinase [Aerococcus sp. HMSC035B07]
MTKECDARVLVLLEALPYVHQFHQKIVLIKFGGHAMVDEEAKLAFAQDIVLMQAVGILPVVVHGGGPFIGKILERMGIQSRFEQGIRITDKETLEVVEMVLDGQVNGDVVKRINQMGGRALGLSGKDAKLIQAGPLALTNDEGEALDLGYVGQVQGINADLVSEVIQADYVPVISSVGVGKDGQVYNINADTVASQLAQALGAVKLVLLTDVKGVYRDPEDPESLISTLSVDEFLQLKEEGILTGGMLPKIEAALAAIHAGVDRVHLISGREPHALLEELFFDAGIGTMIE